MPTISVDKAALFKELGREYVLLWPRLYFICLIVSCASL